MSTPGLSPAQIRLLKRCVETGAWVAKHENVIFTVDARSRVCNFHPRTVGSLLRRGLLGFASISKLTITDKGREVLRGCELTEAQLKLLGRFAEGMVARGSEGSNRWVASDGETIHLSTFEGIVMRGCCYGDGPFIAGKDDTFGNTVVSISPLGMQEWAKRNK